MKKIILAFLLLGLFAVGCSQVNPGQSTKTNYQETTYSSFAGSDKVSISNFKTVDEYKDFIKGRSNYYGGYGFMGGVLRNDIIMVKQTSGIETTSGAGVPRANEYSETNNQVASVDEADIIKTDGNYIYTVTGKTVFIIKAYPGEDAKVVSQIVLDMTPRALFIEGDKLAVFGDVDNYQYLSDMGFRTNNGMAFANFYDITNKEEPKLVNDFKFEGHYDEGRMYNGYVYIMINLYPEYRLDPMPLIMSKDVKIAMPIDNIHYFNIPYNNPSFVGIHAIDMQNPTNVDSQMIAVEGSSNMYMSENNIFITYTETMNEWDLQQEIIKELIEPKLSNTDKDLIQKIMDTDSEVLSNQEKDAKVMQIIESYTNYLGVKERTQLEKDVDDLLQKKLEEIKYFEYTIINKVSVNKDSVNVESNGKVPGHVMNQFSMDENNNVFRIATTISQRWDRKGETTKSTNNVFALDTGLEQLGEMTDIAKGEQIYSTRFMGDRLYMVTFRQVDPFFVIDLSDPRDIKELGQLKIPGFSRYLHPYDDNTIIGIGRDATSEGRQQGLKISLFDVSDVSNPKEIAKYVSDDKYASSAAEYEHKAFLFSKDKELLVIPAYSYSQDKGYNGALVFKINKQEITLRGLIDHSISKVYATEEVGNNGQMVKRMPIWWNYNPAVERSLYINELLYTKSPSLLRINRLSDLNGVKDIELKTVNPEMPVY